MEPSTRTWLLLVDHNFQGVGDYFPVETTPGNVMRHLKVKVKETRPAALSRAHVTDPAELTVWKTKGSNILNRSSRNEPAEILSRIDVDDQDTIEKIYVDARMEDLELSDGEILLVKLPVPRVWPATGQIIPAKRKASDEYVERLKSCNIVIESPSLFNDHSEYAELQRDQAERIMDDRPEPDVVPPLPLLYRGFGHFLDSTSVLAIQSGTSSYPEIQGKVDKLVAEVSRIKDEKAKQKDMQDLICNILFPDGPEFEYKFSDGNQRATDGHILLAHGGPLFITAYKRDIGVAEPRLAAHYIQLATSASPQIVRGWRQPALGLIIRGPYISFHGLVMIGMQVRTLPLTPIFPCTDGAFESRTPLYAAFGAARDLLERIENDAKEFVESLVPENHSPILHQFPDIQSLSLCQSPSDSEPERRIRFQITESLGDGLHDRFLYVAETDSGTILVKFSRTYGKDLHEFCAARNFAPQLLAFEKLPGGWFGIAMEYLSEAVRVTNSPFLIEHWETWLKKAEEIVKAFHEHGYVHGDLRTPNFIVDNEKLLLVDFDWGGKEGEAKFPDADLQPILRAGRHEKLIQKDHDLTVLGYTALDIMAAKQALLRAR